jgi:hypothetical protein
MANLSVTSVCNRTCGYCFARPATGIGTGDSAYMPLETFDRALDFLARSAIDQVRLLGGEPTLHPQFPELVERSLQRGFRVLVFSNGLMPERALEVLEGGPAGRVCVLINALAPGAARPQEHARQARVLKRLRAKASLGLNLDSSASKLGFLVDWIQRDGLDPAIRLGLAHPVPGGSNRFLHPQHYGELGRRIAAFAEVAAGAGVAMEFDCGFVPCMFPEGWLESQGKRAAEVGQRCGPVLDVLCDGSVISCYPLAGLGREPLPQDHDAAWLRRRFEERRSLYRTGGVHRRCGRCVRRAAGDCTGGCLAVSLGRWRRAPPQGDVPGCGGQTGRRSLIRFPTAPSHPQPARSASAQQQPLVPWVIPYIDQGVEFWDSLWELFHGCVGEVYFPLPGGLIGSGRPEQAAQFLADFLRYSRLPRSVLVNPLTLPQPADAIAPAVIESLRRLEGEAGICGATVTSLALAARIREALPDLPLAASVLMDIASPIQAGMLGGVCETLVPASRVMRDRPALESLRAAFPGRIRLLVNEGCLPGCPFRTQHFHEMASSSAFPRSLCHELLRKDPWLRLTGAWVLPQHLHLYGGLYDELKLAGRVTLRDPSRYIRVLSAYVHRQSLTPDAIGAGPASVLEPLEISEAFFRETMHCGRRCHECQRCRRYYDEAIETANTANLQTRSACGRGHNGSLGQPFEYTRQQIPIS